MEIVIILVTIILDRISKFLVSSNMELGEHLTLGNQSLLELYYLQNDGAAYSILRGKQELLVIMTAIIMIALVVYLLIFRKKISLLERISIAMILGGGIGNLICRLRFNYVIDFIDIHIIPVFNVADIAVTCGCILLVITVFFFNKE